MGLRSRWLLAVVPLAVACGGDSEPNYLANQVFPDGGQVDADGGASALDGSVRKDGGKSTYDGGVVEEDPSFDPDAACAASSVAAEQVVVEEQVEVQVPVQVEVEVPAPVALYVMFDKSASMGDGVPLFSAGTHQWDPAVAAMKTFINDSKSSGVDMALKFFPDSGGQCGGGGYATPSVAMGRLPGNANALIQSLDANNPDGLSTPIEGALNGVTQYCKKFQTDHPDEKCIAVLVTDGRPEQACSTNETTIVNIAKNAFNNDGVRTFTVGLSGSDAALLDKIAQAGGTDCDATNARYSCDVSSGADKLSLALGKIRDTVTEYKTEIQTKIETHVTTETRPLACTWNMPQPAAGVAVDKNKVNVTVGGGGTSIKLGKVPGLPSCTVGGWYFDDASNPTQIIACPETCTAITDAHATDVQIQLGCETQVLVI